MSWLRPNLPFLTPLSDAGAGTCDHFSSVGWCSLRVINRGCRRDIMWPWQGASLSGSSVLFSASVAFGRLACWNYSDLHLNVPCQWPSSLLYPPESFPTISGPLSGDQMCPAGTLQWASLPLVGCCLSNLLSDWQTARTCGSRISPMKSESLTRIGRSLFPVLNYSLS